MWKNREKEREREREFDSEKRREKRKYARMLSPKVCGRHRLIILDSKVNASAAAEIELITAVEQSCFSQVLVFQERTRDSSFLMKIDRDIDSHCTFR